MALERLRLMRRSCTWSLVPAGAENIPEIAELDHNPVFARQHGAVVADVRIRLTG